MKKFFSVLMLAAALPAIAAQTARIPVSPVRSDISNREYMKQNNIVPQQAFAPAEGEVEVIVTPPADAEIKNYTRSAEGYNVFFGTSYKNYDEGIVGEIAFCENGDVYLRNPISFKPMGTWIKGTKDGDKLTFNFPQCLGIFMDDDDETTAMEVWVNVLTYHSDDKDIFFAFDDLTPNQITMTMDSEGNVYYEEELEDIIQNGQVYQIPKVMMAITDANENWLGLGDFYNIYEPFDKKMTLIPENLETKDYAMVSNGAGKWVKVAVDETNKELYIAGIYTPVEKEFAYLGEGAIKGKMIEGAGGAIFDSRQYMGVDPYYYHAYLCGGNAKDDGNGNTILEVMDQFIFTYDDKMEKITSANIIAVSEGEKQGYVLETFYYPTFDSQTGYVDPNPAQPTITGYMPYTDEMGYGGVRYFIPNTNNNGQLLHAENLSYSVVIDGKNVVFDPENYPEFDEPTQWIPYDFESYNVEKYEYDLNTRMVYMTDALKNAKKTLSVQSRYKSGDSYYVTTGPTYDIPQPQIEAPVFAPESGYEFESETGEVTITAPEGAIVSYLVVSDSNTSTQFTDSETNVVTLKLTETSSIMAFSKDAADPDNEEVWSARVTATYTLAGNSVSEIAAEFGGDIEIFTIDGLKVETETLEPGFYIVVKNGQSTKIFVKE